MSYATLQLDGYGDPNTGNQRPDGSTKPRQAMPPIQNGPQQTPTPNQNTNKQERELSSHILPPFGVNPASYTATVSLSGMMLMITSCFPTLVGTALHVHANNTLRLGQLAVSLPGTSWAMSSAVK